MAPCPHLLGLLLMMMMMMPPLPWQASACEDLACFADYLETLTCTWGSRRAVANLTGNWRCGLGGTCAFVPSSAAGNDDTRPRWTCPAKQALCMGAERFHVEAAFDGGGRGPGDVPLRRCGKDFGFHDHVKPSPPFNLTALASHDGYTLSWETRYRPLDFLDGELQYELGYRRRGHPWPEPSQKRLPQDTRTLQLRPQELDAGAEYELRVRARPRESSLYQGTWSDWSRPTTLETLPETPGEAHVLLLLLLLLLSFFPALLAVLGWRQRLWKKLDRFVPSPAPFFQPLFLVHKGDFKRWVGASSARAVLDISEWEAVVPEVCQKIGTKYLLPPPSLPEGGSGWKDGQAALPMAVLPSCQLIPADDRHHLGEQEEATPSEQPYGHLSIDTVMVAGELAHCCPSECGSAGLCCGPEQWQEKKNPVEAEGDAYCGFRPEGTHSNQSSGHFFPGAGGTPLPSASPVESPLWEATPALVQGGGFLGGRVVEGGEPFFLCPPPCQNLWAGRPLSLFSPRAEEAPFCREPLPPEMEAEGNLGDGLDLDTMDSGFADGECGSPIDLECQGRQAGSGSAGAEDEKEACLASYVRQWVSCHQLKA